MIWFLNWISLELVQVAKNIAHHVDIMCRAVFSGWRGRHAPSIFFAITCFFCNHLEELQTVLFQVKLIINNAPLTYAYQNTIETCYIQSFVI